MDTPSPSSATQLPQRRVLPSRSRRAGPGAGVGNCDADQMILDTHKRKLEDVPLIPENTRFFLTTSAALSPPEASSSRITINKRSEDRYFDRPEVIKAFRQQTNIETPEFTDIKDTQEVLSRFRARDTDEATMDTSDAAYERRHRKYETMEKRQRLRELEKLKHEQYKLKERIEQLRSMDPNAFLTLPASCFTPVPGHVPVGDDESSANASSSNVNGAAAIQEGERRRKEMLEVASMLEERYRILLPPERHVRKGPPPVPVDLPEPPTSRPSSVRPPKRPPMDDGGPDMDADDHVVAPPEEKIKLKLKLPPKRQSDTNKRAPKKVHGPSPPATIEDILPFPPSIPESASTATPERANSELVLASAPSDTMDGLPSLTDTPMSSPAIAVLEPTAEAVDGDRVPNASSSKASGKNRGRGRPRTSDGQSLKKYHKTVHPPADMPLETASASMPLGRDTSIPPITTLGSGDSISVPIPSKPPRERPPPKKAPVCQLVVVAKRSAGVANPRSNIRHNMAFGFKVPPELDMELTYELPLWLLMDEEFQKRAAKYHPNTGVLDPDFHLDPQFIDDVRRASTEPDEEGNVEMKDSSKVSVEEKRDSIDDDADESTGKGKGTKDVVNVQAGKVEVDDELSSLDSDSIEKDEPRARNDDIESEDELIASRNDR